MLCLHAGVCTVRKFSHSVADMVAEFDTTMPLQNSSKQAKVESDLMRNGIELQLVLKVRWWYHSLLLNWHCSTISNSCPQTNTDSYTNSISHTLFFSAFPHYLITNSAILDYKFREKLKRQGRRIGAVAF